MVLSYYFIPDTTKFVIRLRGELNLQNLFTSIEKIWADPNYNPSYSSIMDLRDTEMNMSTADITKLAGFILADQGQASKGDFIMLVNKPFETALSMIFESKMVGQQTMNIFSTEEAALKALRITQEDFAMLNSPKAVVIEIGNGSEAQKSPDQD